MIVYNGCIVNVCDLLQENYLIRYLVNCYRLLAVIGRDFVSTLQPLWLTVLSPDESEFDRVSKRDRLGITPNLTARDLWRSRRWARKREFCLFIPVGLNEFITCRKILRHGTFPLYFPSERKVCCWFLSPLKIHRLGRVRTSNFWVQWQAQ
jgi:hypothetical protein